MSVAHPSTTPSPPSPTLNIEITGTSELRRLTVGGQRKMSQPSARVTSVLDCFSRKEIFLLKAIHRRLRLIEKYPPKEAQGHAVRNESRLTLHTEADIPHVIKGLCSGDEELFGEAARVIASIANYQLLLFHDEVVPLIPSIFVLISAASNEMRKSALICLLRNVGFASPASFSALVRHANPEAIVALLMTGAPMVRKSVVRLLEGMLVRTGPEDKPDLENKLVEPFRTRFPKPLRSRRSQFGLASLKTGALELLIQIARTLSCLGPTDYCPTGPKGTSTATDLRIAAISCIDGVISGISKNVIKPKDFPYLFFQRPEPRLELQGHIFKPIMNLIDWDDADLTVSNHVVELLNTRYLSASNPVEIFLWTHQGSLERLVRKLALGEGSHNRKEGRVGLMSRDGNTPDKWAILEEAVAPVIGVYSQAAWLLQDIFTRIPQGVVRAFEAFWERGGVDDQTREGLLRILASEVPAEVRGAALCAGLPVPDYIPVVVLREEEKVERPTVAHLTELAAGQMLVVELFRSEL